MCQIEWALKRGANTPHAEYDKEKVEEHKLEIQEILSALDLQSLPPYESPSAIESVTPVAPIVSGTTTATPSGTYSAPPSQTYTEY